MSAGSAVVFAQPMNHMGVIGIASATIATLWNFVFNMGFDRAMLYSRGSVQKRWRSALPILSCSRQDWWSC